MRIETDSEYYYDVLNIYERFTKEVVEKYGNLSKAAKSINRSKGYLYSSYRAGTIRKFYMLCNQLNIDFDYCVTGKNNRHQFIEKNIDFNKLIKIYKQNRYKTRIKDSIKTIISRVKNGRDNIKLATLLYLSELFKVPPIELIWATSNFIFSLITYSMPWLMTQWGL